MEGVLAGTYTPVRALRGALASPLVLAVLVTAVYGGLAAPIVSHHSAEAFAFVGRKFVDRPGTSRVIRDHAHATTQRGYDGQFALFIALDPVHARTAIDTPGYRYTHILYPGFARALALGDADLVPAALIAVNILAVFFGTLALGLILRRHRRRPAPALVFGLFAGAMVSFDRDLSDLLAYALVALALLLFTSTARHRLLLAGAVFGAASLARETTLIFPVVLGVFELLDRTATRRQRLGQAGSLTLPAVLPYAAWRAFLLIWLGPSSSRPQGFTFLPFGGVFPHGQPGAITFMNIATIVVPAMLLLLAIVGGRAIRRDAPFAAIVAIQVLLLVVFLPAQSYADYFAAGRLQLGTPVATLCCLPSLTAVSLRWRQLVGIAAVLAMAPTVVFALVMLGGKPV